MRTLSVLLLVGMFVSLSAPAQAFFGNKFKKIDVDMAEQQVAKILGKPDGKQRNGSNVVWKYFHRMVTGWRWDRADYFVVFQQGRVTEYGPGELRMIDVRGVPTIMIIPL